MLRIESRGGVVKPHERSDVTRVKIAAYRSLMEKDDLTVINGSEDVMAVHEKIWKEIW